MTFEQQLKANGTKAEPTGSFLRDFFGMAAPVMENDHAGSLYPATPAPSPDEIRRSIREFAALMS